MSLQGARDQFLINDFDGSSVEKLALHWSASCWMDLEGFPDVD